MKIDAKVQSISKLKDYFFLVPDYQREYAVSYTHLTLPTIA